MTAVDRARAEQLDRDDPLGAFHDQFVHDDEPRIYLDGNSLGRLPVRTRKRVAELVDDWGRQVVTGWGEWADLPQRLGDRLAAAALGAEPGEVLVSDSTTVNLYKLAAAALDARPERRALVTDWDNFPTDRYVLEGLAAARGLELRIIRGDAVDGPSAADIASACRPGDVALVSLSHVNYRNGALADMAAISAAAHDAGALVLWDECHAVGAVPVRLGADGADLAVGCTYKYLNAGPGAPAFLYVRSGVLGAMRSPIWGWFAQKDQFAMGPAFDPLPGVERFLAGTPPILALAGVAEGVELLAEATIEAVRAKSVLLGELAIDLCDAWLSPLGFTVGSPRESARRGSHVAIRHEEAWPICRALIEFADVVPDFRAPDVVRLGLSPLTTRFADIWDALDRLRRLVAAGEHRRVDSSARRIT